MLVAWSILRTVRDWLEPTGFAHIVSVFGLALAIFGALLVPVDLYNVASLSDSMTGQLVDQDEREEVVEHAAIIVVLYQVVFLSLCGFLFVLLPLAYFWSEAAVQQPDAPPARAALHAAGAWRTRTRTRTRTGEPNPNPNPKPKPKPKPEA